MSQSLSQLYIHAIFSTKNRTRALAYPELRENLNAYAAGILNSLDCHAVMVGSVIDHMHVLFHLNRTVSVADVMATLKKRSSSWIKDQRPEAKDPYLSKFAWQAGYGAFSVSASKVDEVSTYIAGQEDHHRRHTFQDEYLAFLKRHGIGYDEKHLWD